MRFFAIVNVALRSSRGLLTTSLALFSGLLQLPIPLGMDSLLAARMSFGVM